MSPAPRQSSRRTAAAKPGRSGRASTKTPPETDAFAPQDPDAAPGAGRKPGSARANRPPPKKSKAPYILLGLVVVVVIAGVSYRPTMRWVKLGNLDKATGPDAITLANDYLLFESNSEAMVRDAVRSNRGPFEAQLHMATTVKSFPALMTISERKGLTPAQLATTLTTAVEIFDANRNKGDRIPSEMEEWAEKHEDRAVANAAVAVIAKHGGANGDDDVPVLFAAIIAKPGQDPLRVTAALDAMAEIADEENLGHAISLLRTGASDQAVAHAGLCSKIKSNARPAHLGALVELLGHPQATVRALALETLGGLTMPDSADPQARNDLGLRIASKLVPETPPVELAAALKATEGLRLTGARDAVLALLPQRAQLALPGLDDAWWANCIGRALILTQPPAARPASEDMIVKLTERLDDAALRPLVAKALAMVNDREFIQLRPSLDKLGQYAAEPECMEALTSLVKKTYDRGDVAKTCGQDPAAWQAFLAQDRPRSSRVAEIRIYVDTHQDMQLVSKGREKLKETQQWLDAAGTDLQGWLDDKKFVPPLGTTQQQVERLLHDVKILHFGVNKAMPGAM